MSKAANPPRPGHLRATRLRLGLSQEQVGALARFKNWKQSRVSLAEREKAPGDAKAVERALIQVYEERRAERWLIGYRKKELAEHRERIAQQEALWNALPDSPAKTALLEAMIDRCFDLMCMGKGEECDAIAEWLPPDRVKAMFDAWERWSDGEDVNTPAEAETPSPEATGTP